MNEPEIENLDANPEPSPEEAPESLPVGGEGKRDPRLPVRPWKWDDRKVRASVMVAKDEMRDVDIAAAVGVSPPTLYLWKRCPEFQEHVKVLEARLEEMVLTKGIANRANRVRRLNRDWYRMQKLLDQRAEEYTGRVAGGDTGLIVGDLKSIGAGAAAHEVEVFKFDAALMAELRAIEMQAAKELGQWTEKSIVDGDQTITVVLNPQGGKG